MQPLHKVVTTTHFKRIFVHLVGGYKWTPCLPSDRGAVKKTWEGVQSDLLSEPPLTTSDFLQSLDSTKPTVSEADIKRHEEWTKEYGVSNFSLFVCHFNRRLSLFSL
jgi:vacuolar protein-sorting-associated protein 4